MIGKKIRTRFWSWYGIHMNKKIRIRILVHFISRLLIRYRYHDMISKGSDQNRVRIFLFIWIPYQDQNRVRIFLLIISWYRYRISNREIERTRIRIQIFLFVISIPYQDQNRVRVRFFYLSYRYRISNREIKWTRIRIRADPNAVRSWYKEKTYSGSGIQGSEMLKKSIKKLFSGSDWIRIQDLGCQIIFGLKFWRTKFGPIVKKF